jgi:hypothetical protein
LKFRRRRLPAGAAAEKFEAIVAAPQAKIYRALFRAAGENLISRYIY